jgi:histidine kinase/DNA gyrase B/HSP90-like ATPase/nitrate/nitrite sensing protein
VAQPQQQALVRPAPGRPAGGRPAGGRPAPDKSASGRGASGNRSPFGRAAGRGPRTIRTRLLAIAWIPSFTLLIVGLVVAGVFAQRGREARDLGGTLQQATANLTRLVTALEIERQLTVALAINPGPIDTQLAAARSEVDLTLPAIVGSSSNSSIPSITKVRQLRAAAESGQVTPAQVNNAYGQMFTAAGVLFRNLARTSPDEELISGLLNTADLFDVMSARSDAASLREVASREPGLNEAEYQQYVAATGAYRSRVAALAAQGPAAQRETVTELLRSTAWRQELRVQAAVLHTQARRDGTYRVTLPITRGEADAAGAQAGQVIDGLFRQQFAAVGSTAERKGNEQLVRALLLGALLLGLTLAVFLISTRLSRRIIGRLRALRDRTLDLADHQLPAVVERLRSGEPVDIEAELRPIDAGEDEIGQVSDAFGKAQRTAVAAAVAEAETRSGTGKVFLNIARRSQVIVHRQLRVLDQAERSQDDPDQLNLLFELDHLSTRARRNAENLIILGGGRPGRQWRRPVPLLQVARSAIGESERYVRVTTGELPAVPIDGAAVADIVHLLAELIDNATSFSPPTSRVEVRGNLVGRGAVIEVEDQGLGLEPELRDQLNEMLGNPPNFSVMALSDEPRLGLFVVARLAAQHGIRVTLAEAPYYGGTRAIVLLPNALLSPTTVDHAGTDASGEGPGARPAIEEPVIELPDGDPFLARPDPAVPRPARTGPIPVRAADPARRRPTGRRTATPAVGPATNLGPATGAGPVSGPATGDAGPAGSPPAAGPVTGPVTSRISGPGGPAVKPPATDRAAGRAASPATSPNGIPTGERPELPRRVRQASLVPQLRDDQSPAETDAPRPERDAPEQARDRFASLQRGTREGRAAHTSQGDSVD